MREKYVLYGVDNYYKNNCMEYKNPHEYMIKKLLVKNIDKFNSTNVLDLCCGGGEVTLALLENNINNIRGSDAYTYRLYEKNTNKECIKLSFKDILRGNMSGHYSTIICSFAFHLIKEKNLLMIVNEIFRHTDKLILITPHKRPFISKINGIELEYLDYSLTTRGKRVYFKLYNKI